MKLYSESPFQNARASRLTSTSAAARTMKARAEAGVASWSRASLRQRPSQPKVRSITHRCGWTAKPLCFSGAITILTSTAVAEPTRSPA